MDKLPEGAQVNMEAKRRRRLYAQAARLIREEVAVLPLRQQADR